MDQAATQQDKLQDVVEVLTDRLPDSTREALADFARRLMARGSAEFLATHGPEEIAEIVVPLFRLLERAAPGAVEVRVVRDSEDPGQGLVQTVMDDCPFIVDTLREYIHSLGLHIVHLMHPVLIVDRDSAGRVTGIRDRTEEGEPSSIVHISTDGTLDREAEDVADEIRRRLEQLLAVTEDFQPMLERTADVMAELEEKKEEIPWRAAELEEIQELLKWMRDPGFVFLGYRGYRIETDDEGEHWIVVEPGSGLGILREEERSRYAEPKPLEDLPPDLRARVLGGPLLIVSKTNAESPIRRRAQMDYIGIKRLGADGTVKGEHRFLGLLTAKAFNQDASTIPILRRKLNEILQQEGAPKGSHNYNLILQTFNSMPKEELFLSTVEEIRSVIEAVMETEGQDDVRVTARPDSLGRGYNIMVILPKNRFSAAVRRNLQSALLEAYGGRLLNYHLALGQGDQARLHFYVTHDPDEPMPDPARLEEVVQDTVRSWSERLQDALEAEHGPVRGRELAQRWVARFSSEYQAAMTVPTAASDVLQLDQLLESGEQQTNVRPLGPDQQHVFQLKIFAWKGEFVLSDVIPILENLGFRVLDSLRFTVGNPRGATAATVHVFEVEVAPRVAPRLEAAEGRLEEALRAVRKGRAEDDGLNSLVLTADLTWDRVAVLRAYAGYAFRVGAVVSRQGAQRPLTGYPASARLLYELFDARFDPAFEGDREETCRDISRRFQDSLSEVRGIEDDRTLRRIHELILATRRTNHYRRDPRGSPLIALKVDCRAVDFMPAPRPHHEVYLRGPRTEAAHLRMGDVARGGIRWSDRYEDFRVEVLGLVKTQRVKNAVIVPAGAKGAFIARPLPDDPKARADTGLESYREFIRGLLEITDNVVDGEVRTPERVVVHDGPDPYLVVAADKGTAQNSDTANALSLEAGFWLGDAFASGGSNGYDHKKEGITARGAWECVKRHFREMDLDFENEPFIVIGIGDMSGDVFGNGMLLSERIRLVAAFDHRHIFLDPDPDPAESWEERARLFGLPRSSWKDYDERRISEGGGVFDRTAKEIEISPRVRERLGIEREALNGEELIRAVLRAEADLLWTGGIGTYVKATSETHADVGDPSNDGVRVDATEVRARVIGEGGNLGLTQRARIEYALAGGRVNTDAIDNSGGVDMSDREVNLKILLGAAVTRGSLSPDERNELLHACTDQVSEAVLANNYAQSLALSLDRRRAELSTLPFHEAMQRMEREGVLDPALEFLPTADGLEEREAAGASLTRPELATLLAHAKLHLKGWLQSSGVPQDPALSELVRSYFPARALEAVDDADLANHRLHAHIASTLLTNLFVDRMGAASHLRLVSETDRSPASVARTWYVANRISDADSLYARLRAVDGRVRTGAQYQWYLEMSDSLARATRWLLQRTSPVQPIAEAIEWYHEPVRRIRTALPRLLTHERREAFRSHRGLHEMDGLDEETATELVTFRYLDELLPIASLIRESGAETDEVGRVYLGLSEEIDFTWLRARLDALEDGDIWGQRGARILIARLEEARLRIAARVLEDAAERPVEAALQRFRHEHAVDLSRIRSVLGDIRASGATDLASLLVAVDAVASPRLAGPRPG